MAVDHLSLYQLTIEPGTRFGDLAARGRLRGLPAPEAAADMYARDAGGLRRRRDRRPTRPRTTPAPAAESRHNLVYWRYGDYAGIGPGAHGRLTRRRHALGDRGDPGAGGLAGGGRGRRRRGRPRTPVAPAEQAVEMAMMGLRLAEGIDLGRYAALAGAAMPEERIAELAGLGLVARDGDRLRATPAGRPLLDAVLRRLLA